MTDPTGGPNTQAGKEVPRWTPPRHGIRSPAPVVPGLEKAEDWQAHRDGMLESLSPEGHLELVLAERVALLSWRLNRVTRFETVTIALSQEKIEDDLAEKRRFGSYLLGPSHPEEVQLPEAIPEWASLDEYIAEWDGWTVSLVRECISAIASAAKEDEEELIEAATERARLDIISARAAAEGVEQDLARMSRERLLPDDKTLEKVSRYEAHLSRLFHKSLHELEALQTRRSGGAAPLARLDVDGLAGGLR